MNRKKLVTEMGRIDREAFVRAEKLPLVVLLDTLQKVKLAKLDCMLTTIN